MDKVRVLYITDILFGRGGAEKNLLQLVRGLDRSRYLPMVISLGRGKLLKELEREDIFTRDLGLDRIYGIRSLIEAVKLFRLIRRERVKIVVTYHESSDFWGGLIARLAGVPVVISNRRDMGYKLKNHHISAYRIINELFDRIIVVSDAVRDSVAVRQKVLWHKLATVYNGVELTTTAISEDEKHAVRESLGIVNKDWLVVGATGSVRSVKGYRYFIEAASIVIREYPHVYFLAVGSFDDKRYLAQLQRAAAALEVDRNLIFCGPKTDVLRIVRAMDICVSSSLSEGMSNAVLEYMSCAKPVVATRAGGNTEVVEDGKTGYLVPIGDPLLLAASICALCKDEGLRERMGKAGRAAVEKNFSQEKMLKTVDTIFTDLLKEKEKTASGFRFDLGLIWRMFRKLVKTMVSQGMYYGGITFIVKTAGSKFRGLRILAYHRIAAPSYDPLAMSIPPWLFERNILHIRKNYTPISLEEGVHLLRMKKRIPENAIVLTFDDGYRDNYTNAFPILSRYKIPATIFLCVEGVENGEPLWYDKITEAFQFSRCGRLDLRPLGFKVYQWSSDQQKMAVCRQIVMACKLLGKEARTRLVELVSGSMARAEHGNGRLMLDWEQVVYMASKGIDFGSHAMSHAPLSTLSPQEVEYEIRESKRVIRERTGIDVKFFANPNGSLKDFTESTIGLLRQNGYIAACTLVRGINMGGSLYTLQRYCMSPGMVSAFTGTYSRKIFDLHLSQLYEHVRLPEIFPCLGGVRG